ncbi:hypothetical protein CM19_01035 [Candidatus Acidianus copahuensis]|uniref:Major facilitator superfamily (MFS) profile domain-containing protein n=1 Tax=Candidatus Acidianus copahuensis TaxID=1160895 RepID=A0A031LSQ1_9CREN|nr:MFS transporter [Candidatus Acidianus copahuensis]EZQ11412.1 hypothetical protein CM19_01035 [Candidatus Acidianus copahuensis]
MEELKYIDRLRVGFFTLTGTTIEYYDFFLYALLSVLVFPKVFFPPGYNQFLAILVSLSTYFITFVARPLGAMIFGNIGDKKGRREGLVLNMLLVGVAYIIIGFLPTYATLGFISILLLLILRLTFGLGLGGEYGGAIAILLECNNRKRATWSCFVQAGAALGELLALAGLLLLYKDLIETWRILIIVGGVVALINFLIRRSISESPAFLKLLSDNKIAKIPVITTFKHYYKKILISSGMVSLAAGLTTIVATFGLPIMRSEGIPLNVGITYLIIGDAVWLTILVPLAFLGDLLNMRRLMIVYIVAGGILTFPGLIFLFNGRLLLISIILLKVSTASWSLYGVLNALNFPTPIRYTGSGLSYQLGAMYAGGLSPLLASFFVVRGEFLGVYFIVLMYSIISAISTFLNRNIL